MDSNEDKNEHLRGIIRTIKSNFTIQSGVLSEILNNFKTNIAVVCVSN